jgi:exosortase/archaeosortase family protein
LTVLSRSQVVFLKVLLVVGGSILGFALCQGAYRTLEAQLSIRVVRFFQGHQSASLGSIPHSIAVRPDHGSGFLAIITPSCSATASILAIGCLASLSPRFGRLRRLIATLAAIAAVALGNVARISLSVIVGVHRGISSLVLFHDWVGGVMTFVYTLGGYVLMLAILLPNRRRDEAHAKAPLGAV